MLKRATQNGIQFFESKLDKDGRAGATVQAYEVPDALAPFVRAVEKLTKVRIQFVDVNDPSGKAGFGGMYAGRNVLFVNVRARKPVSFIVGHEFLQYLN